MGKKKPNLKVKTSRYFTKTCSNCGEEYPNWFTNCPHCGTAWDESVPEQNNTKQVTTLKKKKTIKIVVKITEDDFEEGIVNVQLIFSADKGKSWYRLDMDMKRDYYIAEIAEVPIGSVIIYYMEVFLENGEKIIENNEGQYYFYEVGGPIRKETEQESKAKAALTAQEQKMMKNQKSNTPQMRKEESSETESGYEHHKSKMVSNPQTQTQTKTIFGTQQVKKEENLKLCPHCNSKIKKMWSTCPICGNRIGE
jgi:hypothetical protein